MPDQITFSNTDRKIDLPGYGCMGISFGLGVPMSEDDGVKILKEAIQTGYTFLDTAIVYGEGHNEKVVGRAIRELDCRDKVFVASKCGIVNGKIDNSPAYIRKAIEASTERLGFAPDLYYLHRISRDTPIEESMACLEELRKQGKFKYIGLSEPSTKTLRKANEVGHVDAVQIEYSFWETSHETNGMIEAANEAKTTVVAFSPIGKGVLAGRFEHPDELPKGDVRRVLFPKFQGENFTENMKLVNIFKDLAAKKGIPPSQLALAWLAEQGAAAIPGSTDSGRLKENWESRNVKLSADELKEIRTAIDRTRPVGDRYIPSHATWINN